MRPEHSKSSIYYAVLLKKKLVVLNDKLIRNIQNNIQVSSLNRVLIAPLIKMGIEGTFDTNELKFHLPRTLCISLMRFTPNTIIVGLINSKRAFVSLLSLSLGINYSCDSLPGCSCYFVLWGINRDRKPRHFKQTPYHKLFADMFSIHSEEPFSLFRIKPLSFSILDVQEDPFLFYWDFKTTIIPVKTFSGKYHYLTSTRKILCDDGYLTLCLPGS